jgi:hypothetical protein
MYSGEYDVSGVTLSVYPHQARLKNMPGYGGNQIQLRNTNTHTKNHNQGSWKNPPCIGIGFLGGGGKCIQQNTVDIPLADKTSSELSRRQ